MKDARPHIVPKYVIYGFFILGLVSAVAFRAIIILEHIERDWVRPVWYVGAIGYFLFFLYRYRITRKRKKAVSDFGLIEKLKAESALSSEDRDVILYLLSSIKSSPEDLNYAIIFLLSVIAIAADLILSMR